MSVPDREGTSVVDSDGVPVWLRENDNDGVRDPVRLQDVESRRDAVDEGLEVGVCVRVWEKVVEPNRVKVVAVNVPVAVPLRACEPVAVVVSVFVWEGVKVKVEVNVADGD